MMRKRPPWPAATFVSPLLLLALQGCAAPMTAPTHRPVYPPPGHLPPSLNRAEDGPLRFWQHNFGAYCFSTWGCRIRYGSLLVEDHAPTEWMEPIEAAAGDMRLRMKGGHLAIKNFAGPVVIDWHDSHHAPLHLEIDLADLFADGLIRHNVGRGDIAEGVSIGDPDIIVEVNDRTVRVYMRAHIPLKRPRDPGNPYSNFVDENVQVFEKHL